MAEKRGFRLKINSAKGGADSVDDSAAHNAVDNVSAVTDGVGLGGGDASAVTGDSATLGADGASTEAVVGAFGGGDTSSELTGAGVSEASSEKSAPSVATDTSSVSENSTKYERGLDEEAAKDISEGSAMADIGAADKAEADGRAEASVAAGLEDAGALIENARREAEAAELMRRRRAADAERSERSRAKEAAKVAAADEKRAKRIEEERYAALAYAEDYRRRLREERGGRDKAERERARAEERERAREDERREIERRVESEQSEARERNARTDDLLSRVSTVIGFGRDGSRSLGSDLGESSTSVADCSSASSGAASSGAASSGSASLGADLSSGSAAALSRDAGDEAAEYSAELGAVVAEADISSTALNEGGATVSGACASDSARGGISLSEDGEHYLTDTPDDDDGIINIDLGIESHILHIEGGVVADIDLGASAGAQGSVAAAARIRREQKAKEVGTRGEFSRNNGTVCEFDNGIDDNAGTARGGRYTDDGGAASRIDAHDGESGSLDTEAERIHATDLDRDIALADDRAARREAQLRAAEERDALLEYDRISKERAPSSEDMRDASNYDVESELGATVASLPDEAALSAKLTRKEKKRLKKAEKQAQGEEMLAFLAAMKEEKATARANEQAITPSAAQDPSALDGKESKVRDRKRDRREAKYRQNEDRRTEREEMDALLALDREDRRRGEGASSGGEGAAESEAPRDKKGIKAELKALIRTVKEQKKRDEEVIRLRFRSKLRSLELDNEAYDMSFAELGKRSKQDRADSKRQHKELEKQAKLAQELEKLDNDRYYALVLENLDRARLSKRADRARLIEIREELIDLLSRRDQINIRLIELYSGVSGGSKGGEEASAEAERRGRRREYKRLSSLERRLTNNKVSYDMRKGILELMDERVSLKGSEERIRFILKRERPRGARKKELKKELKRIVRMLKDNDYKLERLADRGLTKARERRSRNTFSMVGWILLIALLAAGAVCYIYRAEIWAFISELIAKFMPAPPAP